MHCFALGSLLGHPGCTALVRHGLDGLRRVFHDPGHGGWFWTTADPRKQAYGHAFVLLAAHVRQSVGRRWCIEEYRNSPMRSGGPERIPGKNCGQLCASPD